MGQRLNLEIRTIGNKTLANCYYHWSGYTESSLEMVKKAIEYIKNNDVDVESVEDAIKILEYTGASFNKNSWEEALKLGFVKGEYTKEQAEYCSRDNGLIAVDNKNIQDTINWSEGTIILWINDKTIFF